MATDLDRELLERMQDILDKISADLPVTDGLVIAWIDNKGIMSTEKFCTDGQLAYMVACLQNDLMLRLAGRRKLVHD